MPRRFGGFPIRESNVFVLYNNIVDRSGTVRNLMFRNIDPSGRQDTENTLLTGPSRISKSSNSSNTMVIQYYCGELPLAPALRGNAQQRVFAGSKR